MCTWNAVGGNKLKKHPVMQQRTSKKNKNKFTKQYLDGAIGRTGVKAPGGPVDACDQCCVSHINLGHGFQRAVPHGEGVQLAGDVPRPHLTVAVAHAQQVRVELGMEESSV